MEFGSWGLLVDGWVEKEVFEIKWNLASSFCVLLS
jgi:hypothetical protein